MGLSVNWTQPRKEISEFEGMSVETSQTEKQRGKQKKQTKMEQNIQERWDNYKSFKICIMEISEEKE